MPPSPVLNCPEVSRSWPAPHGFLRASDTGHYLHCVILLEDTNSDKTEGGCVPLRPAPRCGQHNPGFSSAVAWDGPLGRLSSDVLRRDPPTTSTKPTTLGRSVQGQKSFTSGQPWASCSFYGIKHCPLFRNIILISHQWKSGQKLSDQGQRVGGGGMAQGAGVPPSWPPTPCPSPTPGLPLACLDSFSWIPT